MCTTTLFENPLWTARSTLTLHGGMGYLRSVLDPHRKVLATCVSLVVGVAAGCVPAAYQKPWIEVKTAHFSLTSALDEQATTKVAQSLEQFHYAVEVLTAQHFEDPPVPTHIFVFDAQGYDEFKPDRHTGGYFAQRTRANWVVMAPHLWSATREIIQHEYVHFLLHNLSAAHYPHWYDEGLAEFLSSIYIEGRKVLVGAVSPTMRANLRSRSWIPMSRIVDPNSWQTTGQYYGESWALVYYLSYGRETRPKGETTRYVALLEQGRDPQSAFADTFRLTTAEADHAVQEHVARLASNKVQPMVVELVGEDFEEPPPTWIRKLGAAEVAADLGELWLAVGHRGEDTRAERALEYFQVAIQDERVRARAASGMGRALNLQKKYNEAERYFRQAIELDPHDPAREVDFGEYLLQRAEENMSPAQRAPLLEQARAHLVSAWKMDPDLPEAYAFYGASFIPTGEPAEKGLATLEHAAELLPSNLGIRVDLAQLYLRLGRAKDAKRLLTSVINWMHPSDAMTEKLKQLLQRVAHAGSSAPQS